MNELSDAIKQGKAKVNRKIEALEVAESMLEQKKTASKILVELAADVALFHSPDGQTFATMPIKEHRETWPIVSRSFKDWIRGQYYKQEEKPPPSNALHDALGVLSAQGQFEGPEFKVFRRIAWNDGKVYIDLAAPSGMAIEIDSIGWRLTDNPPVKFLRSKSLSPMPEPDTGTYGIEYLKNFVNSADSESDFRLILVWLIAAFLDIPYPVLGLTAEAGAGKSTLTRILSKLIDPFEGDLRRPPRDERDLVITAGNGWLLAFDNLSGFPNWLSDAFCVMATGGGFSTRTLYSNDEETIFKNRRPIILNGIDDLANRGDLLSRSIIINLEAIKERKHEAEIYDDFEKARPSIFADILITLSGVLKILATVKVPDLPRMADFARVGVAVEKVLGWPEGSFIEIYQSNISDLSGIPLETTLAVAIINLVESKAIEATATELLENLEGLVEEKTRKKREWPQSARSLSNALRRLAPSLRKIGIEVVFHPRKNSKRLISIERVEKEDKDAKSSSPSSLHHQPLKNNDLEGDAKKTASSPSVTYRHADKEQVSIKSSTYGNGDASDEGDDRNPLLSFDEEAEVLNL